MKLTEAPKFRPLRADEIEVRTARVFPQGAQFLLYKDARCDMNILDEVVKPENWQRKHYEMKGNLFCSVGIKINDEWVWKDDAGAESNMSKEKGEASDSFKRACFNWGIGRELYTSPFIWINRNKLKIEKSNNGIEQVKDKLHVSIIKAVEGKIIKLQIKTDKDVVVFSQGLSGEEIKETVEKEKPAVEEIQKCDDCGLFIKGFTDKKNIYWPPKKAIDFSQKNYGKKLCQKCMKIANDSAKIAKGKK